MQTKSVFILCVFLVLTMILGSCVPVSMITETETISETETDTLAITDTEAETDTTEIVVKTTGEKEKNSMYVFETPKFEKTSYSASTPEYLKALWLSQFDLASVYKNGSAQRSSDDFEALMGIILDNAVENGFNAVIIQVRPYADSFYPSELYPMSDFISGMFGREIKYDPFARIVKLAKARGLSVHAWINPLRGMTEEQIKLVPNSYPIKKWYNDPQRKGKYIVYVNDRWYLNPAYGEVRGLIAAGAAEIVSKYNVDGVHMDDYFYPTTSSDFDYSAYAAYKSENGYIALDNYRREMLSQTVSGIYKAVKDINPSALFGISPAGEINTVYNSHYADVYRWCSEPGFVDYICPQVYFGMEHDTCDFEKVSKIWLDTVKLDSIRLFIGMSLGKAKSEVDNYAGSGKYEWRDNKDVLKRCFDYISGVKRCSGVVYFCYQYFYDPLTGVEVSATKTERENLFPI
ncbi:MAG: family 10 glycosylhydrolase [Oscillospiraceae bacterium]|nr:family 10 glycosylhydrolase [Oscillospiraceae bacterium]